MNSLYFEAHVTVEPQVDDAQFKRICAAHSFRVAELLMKKRAADTPERSQYDSFCTGRGDSLIDLRDRMLAVVQACSDSGIKVWRYKLESTLLDVRLGEDKMQMKFENNINFAGEPK